MIIAANPSISKDLLESGGMRTEQDKMRDRREG